MHHDDVRILGQHGAFPGAAKPRREAGADYVAFGAFYPSETKSDTTPAEPDVLTWCQMFLTLPCVAIGGITLENAAPLVSAGADFLAVSNGVWNHNDGPAAAVAMFNRVIDEAMVSSKV